MAAAVAKVSRRNPRSLVIDRSADSMDAAHTHTCGSGPGPARRWPWAALALSWTATAVLLLLLAGAVRHDNIVRAELDELRAEVMQQSANRAADNQIIGDRLDSITARSGE